MQLAEECGSSSCPSIEIIEFGFLLQDKQSKKQNYSII